MKAIYAGYCYLCEKPIVEGQEIDRDDLDEKWHHRVCPIIKVARCKICSDVLVEGRCESCG